MANAKNRLKFEVNFIRDQGHWSEIFFRSSCMFMMDIIEWTSKNRGRIGFESKHSAKREKTQNHRALSELIYRQNTNTTKSKENK